MGIMMLLVLAVVRNDLLSDWRRSLPADTPNFFFINIPADQSEQFGRFLEERGAQDVQVRPMVRARMTHINGKPIEEMDFPTPRARGFANRDQNITWTGELNRDNLVTDGEWFTPADHGKPLVSIATEYQEELQLKIGDTLQFDIAGETQTATVSSVRKVKWDSFQPNFFLIFAPGLLDGTQGTYMTAVHMDARNPKTIGDLVRTFPSVSVFNVDDLLCRPAARKDAMRAPCCVRSAHPAVSYSRDSCRNSPRWAFCRAFSPPRVLPSRACTSLAMCCRSPTRWIRGSGSMDSSGVDCWSASPDGWRRVPW
jgi:putative ABC transport system permease protein